MLFLERANKEHSFPVESTPDAEHDEHEILATNPCGEQYLEEYEACNLGHINLSTLVAENQSHETVDERFAKADTLSEEIEDAPTDQDFRDFTEKRRQNGWDGEKSDPEHIGLFLSQAVNWEEFNRRIDLGTRFLENVVTMSDFPIKEIEETVRQNRKVGLGIM